MAKDILVNTQSGDLIVSDNTPYADYWPVVWGKVFDSDESEYMNIVVPSGYVNEVRYKDNQFECTVHADYYPVNDTFLVRLIVENAAFGSYNVIQDFSSNAPEEMGAVYYPRQDAHLARPHTLQPIPRAPKRVATTRSINYWAASLRRTKLMGLLLAQGALTCPKAESTPC